MKKSRRFLALAVALVVLAVMVPVYTWAAGAPALISAEVQQKNVLVNQDVVFRVVTDTNATKVRVVNEDGTTYSIANIDAGFASYADVDGQRTWTITKKAQFSGVTTKTIQVGSTIYGYGPQKLKIKFGSHFTEDEFTDIDAEPATRGMEGTFIQSWMVRDWTQERWNAEFAAMQEAGMKYLIVQSVTDVAYQTSGSAYGQDYSRYPKDYAVSMYPSELPLLSGTNNGIDSLERCFAAAKAHDIQLYLGPCSDNRWWLFGWGMPSAPAGVTDLKKDSYFANWARENAELNNSVMEEIYNRYADKYADTLAGWYYYNEVWNIDVACAGTDNGVYAEILSDSMNRIIAKINELDSSKKFMLSPFYNTTISTAVQNGDMWASILEKTNFRQGDIFAPQDCIGGHPDDAFNGTIDTWTKELKRASLANSNVSFWSNNENFIEGGGIALLDRYIQQLEVTSQYAEKNICFSWNHYYSPELVNQGYQNTYLNYLENGVLESQAPTAPTLSKSGYTINISGSTDNIGVCGYYIYKGDMNTLAATLVCDKNSVPSSYTANSAGTYYVVAYDFANNKSEPVQVVV